MATKLRIIGIIIVVGVVILIACSTILLRIEGVMFPEERMSRWLKTRQHLYSQLDYQEVIPLNIPADVVERLNTEVGPPAEVLENTPYPIWRVREPKHYLAYENEAISGLKEGRISLWWD